MPVGWLLGAVFGFLFLKIEQLTNQLAKKINSPIIPAIIAGIAIGLFALWSPYFIFSGEHQLLPLSKEALVVRSGESLFDQFLFCLWLERRKNLSCYFLQHCDWVCFSAPISLHTRPDCRDRCCIQCNDHSRATIHQCCTAAFTVSRSIFPSYCYQQFRNK